VRAASVSLIFASSVFIFSSIEAFSLVAAALIATKAVFLASTFDFCSLSLDLVASSHSPTVAVARALNGAIISMISEDFFPEKSKAATFSVSALNSAQV